MNIIAVGQTEIDHVAPLFPLEVANAIRDGFPVTAFAAVDNNLAVGALSGFIEDDSFELESIFVHPDYRFKGVGKALIRRLFELLEGEALTIRAEINLQDIRDEERKALGAFLISMGFTQEEDRLPCWYVGTVGNLHLKDPGVKSENINIIGFEDVSENALKEVEEKAYDKVMPVPDKGMTAWEIDKHVSSCILQDGEIKGYLAVEVIDEGIIRIPALYSAHADPRTMMSMVARTVNLLKEINTGDTRIAMLTMNPIVEKLIHQIFTDAVNCTKRFVRV